ncbi:MAG: hypothetical protein HY777_13605 [Betaproteobacteria bacterium]|nr:hypothetical protein [Betaproteobacteria bacterium]
MNGKRRRFIQAGVAGSVLLAFSGWLNAANARGLNAAERDMLTAVAAALLDGVLPTENGARRKLLARTVDGIAKAVSGLSAATQKEIGELFGLLTLLPGRLLIAGVGSSWAEAGPAEVAGFLQSWRFSRLGLLQSGYAALHDLTFGAWYARTESWETIGYPGSPEVF